MKLMLRVQAEVSAQSRGCWGQSPRTVCPPRDSLLCTSNGFKEPVPGYRLSIWDSRPPSAVLSWLTSFLPVIPPLHLFLYLIPVRDGLLPLSPQSTYGWFSIGAQTYTVCSESHLGVLCHRVRQLTGKLNGMIWPSSSLFIARLKPGGLYQCQYPDCNTGCDKSSFTVIIQIHK